jgi:xanthine dehydrogenase accessory factor
MPFIVIRGGGDLGSGVALCLHRSGLPVVICDLPEPLAVRRRVAFATAIYTGSIKVEDCFACRVDDPEEVMNVERVIAKGQIPVLVDPFGFTIEFLRPKIVIDARMLKQNLRRPFNPVRLLIGLGPGFIAGENCDAVIETNRSASMGQIIWKGPTEPDTGSPEAVEGHKDARILRAPIDGVVETYAYIGDRLVTGQTVAQVGGHFVSAAFNGILRGLIHPGLTVKAGTKIGDLDPREDPRVIDQISDKALAVGGGVLEAIRSKFELTDLKEK